MIKKMLMILLIHLSCNSLVRADTIKVMVMDAPVDLGHPMLKRVKEAFKSDDKYPLRENKLNNHGTHVTGLVVYGPMEEVGDNTDELCKEVEIVSCRIFDFNITDNDLLQNQIKCIDYAIKNGIEFINMSYGGTGEYDPEHELFKKLNKANIKVIAATGNDGKNIDKTPYYPASYHKTFDNIIPVGNFSNGSFTQTSNYGSNVVKVDGQNVLSTTAYGGEGYGRLSGTSMSAAIHTHNLLKHQCHLLKSRSSYGSGLKQWPM